MKTVFTALVMGMVILSTAPASVSFAGGMYNGPALTGIQIEPPKALKNGPALTGVQIDLSGDYITEEDN